MGMSSSQARLLTLTARMHDIEYKAAKLEAQKLQMANESRRVYEDYLIALDATKIQFKSINANGSITFKDATLATLENGRIQSYSGETSATPFFLKDIKSGMTYISADYATSLGITENTTPYEGTLEDWLWEKGADTKEEQYIKDYVDDPENVKSIIKNGAIPSYTAASYTDFDNAIVNSVSEYPERLISGKTYIISSADDLAHLSQLINTKDESGNYQTSNINIVLANDIYMSSLSGEYTFTSLGTPEDPTESRSFVGNFYGNGHSISGLTTALFGTVSGGKIQDVKLENVNINRSAEYTGALANIANDCTITNIDASGTVKGGGKVGGLIGASTISTIENCSTTNMAVTGGTCVGGLIGVSTGSTVNNCSAAGNVTGTNAVGGFCGQTTSHSKTNKDNEITNCISNCTVTVNGNKSGGFCGFAVGNSVFENCQAEGNLILTSSAQTPTLGGFLGSCGNSDSKYYHYAANVTINNSQSNVTITNNSSSATVSGFAGSMPGGAHKDFDSDGNFTGISDVNSKLTVNNCSFTNESSSGLSYGFVYQAPASDSSSLGDGDYAKDAIVNVSNCTTSIPAPSTGEAGAKPFSNIVTLSASGSGDSSATTVSWVMPVNTQSTEGGINVSDLGDEVNAVASINALTSNIRAVLIKQGEYDYQEGANPDSTLETNIAKFLGSSSFADNAEDNTKLYYLNEVICDYLKNGTPSDVISALVNDIKNGKVKSNSTAMQKSAITSHPTNLTMMRLANASDNSDKWSPTYNGIVEGEYNIPDNETLKKNMKAVFDKYDYNSDNIDTFFGKYNTSDEQDLAYLAKINDMLADCVSHNSTSYISDLVSKVTAGEKYKPTGTIDINNYEIKQTITGEPEFNKKPVYDTKDVIDYSTEKTKQLVELYYLQQTGFIIVGDSDDVGMDHSTEWLTNMINSGTAVLVEMVEKGEDIEEIETSVSTNTKLQEVSDEKNLKKAEAKYEADMKRIDMKDRKYDTQLAALDNERNAIKQEMDTLKTVARDNVDRTFKLFS